MFILKRFMSILAVVMMAAGLSLIIYPGVSSWWRDRVQTGVANAYYQNAALLCQYEKYEHLQRATAHNDDLRRLNELGVLLLGYRAVLPEDYKQILNVDGVMARLEIPKINLDLPVLHGTYGDTMQNGVGHLEGTAFPTGGYGTHAVLTTHSGFTGARLFSYLHNVEIDDLFYITVLGQRLVYQVDQIEIVLPHEIELLRVIPSADVVTLITCTPIAVNTHRLLVRGSRVAYVPYVPELIIEAEAMIIDREISLWGGVAALVVIVIAKLGAVKLRHAA